MSLIRRISDWWNFRNIIIGWDFLMFGDWTGGTGSPGDPAQYRRGVMWIPLRKDGKGKFPSLFDAEDEGRVRYFDNLSKHKEAQS